MRNNAGVSPRSLARVTRYILKNYKAACLAVVLGIIVCALATLAGTLFMQSLIDDYIAPMLLQASPDYAPLGRALVTLAAVLLVGVRLVGLTPYVVLSGSMEPTYPTGSLIYVRDVEPTEVEVGDPITFVLNEELTVATHRVVEVNETDGWFRTKGDANDAPDGSPVLFENLIGEPVFCIPKLGYLTNFLTNPPGMYLGWSAVVILLILLFAPDLLKWADKQDQKPRGKREAHGTSDDGGTPKGSK